MTHKDELIAELVEDHRAMQDVINGYNPLLVKWRLKERCKAIDTALAKARAAGKEPHP